MRLEYGVPMMPGPNWEAPPWPDPNEETNCIQCGVEFDGTNRSDKRMAYLFAGVHGPLCTTCSPDPVEEARRTFWRANPGR